MYTRHFPEAARLLEGLLANSEALPKNLIATYRARLAVVKRLMGDAEGARKDLVAARDELEALRKQSNKGESFLNALIVLEAMLGNQAAVDQQAVALQNQIAGDAFFGPELEESIASARAQLGQTDTAIAIIRDLLTKPGNDCLTGALLRADPFWDSIRSDPRFQELAATKP